MSLVIPKLNILVRKGEKLGESSLLKKSGACFDGLRDVFQGVSRDVVELTGKAKINYDKLDFEVLKNLSSKGLSLREIASALGVSVHKIRRFLDRNNIATDLQKEYRVLRGYFTESDEKTKSKLFGEIDKYLKQIAKDVAKKRPGTSFEDCLQDVRLRFFEYAEKSRKKGVLFPREIFNNVRASFADVPKEIKTQKLGKSVMKKADIPVEDIQTRIFEADDFRKCFWKAMSKGYNLSPRKAEILKQRLEEGKSVNEIAEDFDLSVDYLKKLLKESLIMAQKKLKALSSVKHIQESIGSWKDKAK